MSKVFKPEEIETFVHDHMQSKIDNGELGFTGINMTDVDAFTREFELYKTALFEGICNGIIMCGCKVEGIE